MKILSIIPARGGSKRLPKKNIIDLAGKPLIAWTIEASLKSKHISQTIVTSDNEDILQISKKYGANIFKRPDELALDTTLSEPVIENVLENIQDVNKYDYLILLQPTSPLRDEKDIDSAIELLLQKKVTALISIKQIDNIILKAVKNNAQGYLEGIANNTYPFLRKQDLPEVYIPTGAIYIVKIIEFLKNKKLLTNQTIPFIMNEEKSLDIDTKEDFANVLEVINNKQLDNFKAQ